MAMNTVSWYRIPTEKNMRAISPHVATIAALPDTCLGRGIVAASRAASRAASGGISTVSSTGRSFLDVGFGRWTAIITKVFAC